MAAFFAAYWAFGLLPATGILCVAAAAAAALVFFLERRVAWMPVFTAVAVGIFGGLSLVFEDNTFVKMRPTIVQALIAAVLIGGAAMGRLFLKDLLARSVAIGDRGWRILTWRLAGFFLFDAALNEVVWRTQTNDVWATFDTFGPIVLTVLFVLAQGPLISRHSLPLPGEAETD